MRTDSYFIVGLVVILSFFGCVERATVPDFDFSATIGRLDKVAGAYGIEIAAIDPPFPVNTAHGFIDGRTCRASDIHEYARLLDEELSLYPRDLVRRTGLRRIVLCKNLTYAGQPRGGVPDFEHDTLYLNVGAGKYDRYHRRAVIHHEFFHLLDYRDDGLVYEDRAWAALNPADFQYGTGGRHAQTQLDTSIPTDKFPGFLNHYGTTGVEEDKAELFSLLIVRPKYVELRTEKDAVLQAKVERLKRQLELFCPDADHAFWNTVAAFQR